MAIFKVTFLNRDLSIDKKRLPMIFDAKNITEARMRVKRKSKRNYNIQDITFTKNFLRQNRATQKEVDSSEDTDTSGDDITMAKSFKTFGQLESFIESKHYGRVLRDITELSQRDSLAHKSRKNAEELVLGWWNKNFNKPDVTAHTPAYVMLYMLRKKVSR